MRKIKIPSYNYIKSLSTVDSDYEDCYKDYSWVLFETVGTTGMLTYNKDDEKTLYFYIEGDTIDFYSFETPFNEEGYKKLCKHVKKIFEECSVYETRWVSPENIDRLMLYAIALEAYDKKDVNAITDARVNEIITGQPDDYAKSILETFRAYVMS